MRAAAALAALSFSTCGCLVAGSKYDMKTREADALRDALAVVNKEKTVLEARNEALQKQVSDGKQAVSDLTSRLGNQDEEMRRMGTELSSARRTYEGTRITREQLITELLEKEKATGKRIQDLSDRAEACEQEAEKLRKERAALEAQASELRRKTEPPPDAMALRRERDVLLGRVERLTDELSREPARRDERYRALSEAIAGLSPSVSVSRLGPGMHLSIPEKVLLRRPGKPGLSDAAGSILKEVRRIAEDYPAAAVVVTARDAAPADDIRTGLSGSPGFSPERILVRQAFSPGSAGPRDGGAELLLFIP